MRPQPVRVAIDLETTGLHAEQDAIIEIGAVKYAGDRVLETFETFVAPGTSVPYRIQRLTGITTAQVRNAPALAAVLPRLRAFLGELPLVGHNVSFDLAFLRRAGLTEQHPLLDTYELASALLPGLKGYSLGAVGAALEVPSQTHHRALADAHLARTVSLALLARLEDLDSPTLEALATLPAPPGWTLRTLALAELQARGQRHARRQRDAAGTLGAQLSAQLGMDPALFSLAVANLPPAAPAPSPPATESAPADDLSPLAATLRSGGCLLVEVEHAALLPALAPALHWAATEGRVLLAVAESAALPDFATHKVPAALAALGYDPQAVGVAALAGQEEYACLHRWFGAARLDRGEAVSRDVARGLAKLAVWMAQTQTGLRAEAGLAGAEAEAWESVRGGPEYLSATATCAYRSGGYCFAARAEEAASQARVVVTTHAALAAHLAGRRALPEATRVVVLDAHLFEEELRREQTATLDARDLRALLATLATPQNGGQRAGLLHLHAEQARAAGEPQHERAWFESVARANLAITAFFAALTGVLAEAHEEERQGRGGRSEGAEVRLLRLDARACTTLGWEAALRAWGEVERHLATLHGLLAQLAPRATPALRDELEAACARIEAVRRLGRELPQRDERSGEVHWLRVPYTQTGWSPRRAEQAASEASEEAEAPIVSRAPVSVRGLLAPLLAEGRTLVLAAPALTVAGEFDFFRQGLGLPHETPGLASRAEVTGQTLLCLPSDVPEPNAPQYQRHLEELLISLARALEGRVVALFPSHAALRASAQGIRRALERLDILTLAQGQDGSARQLWQTFATQPRVVLLGAGTFWDGAEHGEHLPACVVVARLPFPALSDPLVAARAEQWDDPQSQFVVPQAALKLRQALSGLAWSHPRRNAVVLFDRRVQTRSYGATILGTLPRCTTEHHSVEDLAERVADWVADGGSALGGAGG